jgi:hypothetical protein
VLESGRNSHRRITSDRVIAFIIPNLLEADLGRVGLTPSFVRVARDAAGTPGLRWKIDEDFILAYLRIDITKAF